MDNTEKIELGRQFTKFDDDPDYKSDQELELPQPPLVKAATSEILLDLPMDFEHLSINNDIISLFYQRQSYRIFSQQSMSLLELSFLLWATQGIKEIRGNNYATIRTVPCGGARHEFETYLVVKNIEGLKSGFYHYLPLDDQIELLSEQADTADLVSQALMGQAWASKANVVFFWSLVPYRAEWRYGIFAHRVMMMDIGHVGENLYLACEALGLGTCGVGAFDRNISNGLFGLEGSQEYIVYAAPVGTVNRQVKDQTYLSLNRKKQG